MCRRHLVTLVALALTLAACGEEGESTTTGPGENAGTQPPDSAPGDGGTVAGGDQGEAGEAASGDDATEQAEPQPGTGIGAANALIAAAAVLTRAGTPEQACGSFVTESFIRSSYGGEQNCVAARRPEALARSIVLGPGDDESSTNLIVVPKGGPYDGAKVDVALVEDDDGFRVDRLTADIPAGP
jgi:hypothetical protein